jgi:hypothetical protein
MTLHLGILQTDSVLDGLQERFGDYPEMFGGLFTAEDPSIRITTLRCSADAADHARL